MMHFPFALLCLGFLWIVSHLGLRQRRPTPRLSRVTSSLMQFNKLFLTFKRSRNLPNHQIILIFETKEQNKKKKTSLESLTECLFLAISRHFLGRLPKLHYLIHICESVKSVVGSAANPLSQLIMSYCVTLWHGNILQSAFIRSFLLSIY